MSSDLIGTAVVCVVRGPAKALAQEVSASANDFFERHAGWRVTLNQQANAPMALTILTITCGSKLYCIRWYSERVQ